MKNKEVQIPEHSAEALKEVENMGVLFYDYANYEGNNIVAYKRWGRGYMKAIFKRVNDG